MHNLDTSLVLQQYIIEYGRDPYLHILESLHKPHSYYPNLIKTSLVLYITRDYTITKLVFLQNGL